MWVAPGKRITTTRLSRQGKAPRKACRDRAAHRDNSLSQQATGSRHDPYRDGQPHHDKVASDQGDTFSDVATCSTVVTSAGRPTAGMLHLGAQALAPVPQEHGHGGPSIMERFKRMAPPSFKGESQPLLAKS
ncbi:hypothetical protein Taro_047363 [Colocasia esculenta]|uniref:Uncharacterized protein n=1 Tax=Colocasia esculenta TaxID=4460 RepID=A0A843WSQ4_COLES|nr:hypothetical protein [Colocasia esculenta]